MSIVERKLYTINLEYSLISCGTFLQTRSKDMMTEILTGTISADKLTVFAYKIQNRNLLKNIAELVLPLIPFMIKHFFLSNIYFVHHDIDGTDPEAYYYTSKAFRLGLKEFRSLQFFFYIFCFVL